MTFLTRREVEAMSLKKAQTALKDLKQIYDTEKPLSEADFFQRVWPRLDDIANTMLYLEDHIQSLTTSEAISQAVRAQRARAAEEQQEE
jgi:hypothetical protein